MKRKQILVTIQAGNILNKTGGKRNQLTQGKKKKLTHEDRNQLRKGGKEVN